MVIGVALGSNEGDSEEEVRQAITFLEGRGRLREVSSLYYTDPVDCLEGAPHFINAVVELETEGDDAMAFLKQCQQYELDRGRLAKSIREVNAPRPIDLDLLYADEQVLLEDALILPHPRLHERMFVLAPLAEIVPEKQLPGFSKSVKELYGKLKEELENSGEQLCQKM